MLPKPLLLTDFLFNCFSMGGVISMLALLYRSTLPSSRPQTMLLSSTFMLTQVAPSSRRRVAGIPDLQPSHSRALQFCQTSSSTNLRQVQETSSAERRLVPSSRKNIFLSI